MVSTSRETYTKAFYHVYIRGARRLPLFHSKKDCEKLLYIFNDAFEKYNFVVHSFCLMNNHYHFLIETNGSKDEITKIMRYVNSRFAIYLNKQQELSGHVFEDRFQSKVVYDLPGLLRLIRYIERNPVKINLVKNCQEWDWSSSSNNIRLHYNFNFYSNDLAQNFFYQEEKPLEEFFNFINLSVDDVIFDPLNSNNYAIYKIDQYCDTITNMNFKKKNMLKAFLLKELCDLTFMEISKDYCNSSETSIRKNYSRINRDEVEYSQEFKQIAKNIRKSMKSQTPQGKV